LVVQTHETEDSLTIIPLSASRVAALAADTRREESTVVAFDTYDDHRMAMAFALAACAPMAIIINEPGCVRKTYPYFFSVLHQVSVQEDDKKK
jgi:5-enolpyruvylshikimate-3-phosphate synthase